MKMKTLVLTVNRGQVLSNTLDPSQFDSMIGHSSILEPCKPNSKPQAQSKLSTHFLCLKKNDKNETELCLARHIKEFEDARQSSIISDGVTLRRYNFDRRGFKTMSIHKGKYLAVATFINVDAIKAPKNYIKDQGWSVNSKNMAQDLKYRLDIFELPKYYQSEEN